jgi:hypothetical protein
MVRIFGIGLAVGFGVWSVLKVWDLIRDYRIDNGHGGLANDGDDWAPFPACQSEDSGQDYPGEGWRLLVKGELIQKGDEMEYEEDDWHEAFIIGQAVDGATVRRRIVTTREVLKRATGKRPDIEQQVCQDILDRQKLGIAKYVKTLDYNPLELREWLQHALEECLDQAVYLRRAMAEMDEQERLDRDK